MTDFQRLYNQYGDYNILYNQLQLTSPSIEYAWHRTKSLLHAQAVHVIQEKLQQQKVVRVADIGCGNGGVLIRLAETFRDQPVEFFGFELSQPFVHYATQAAEYKQLNSITFKQWDIEKKGKLPGKYDVLLSSEVLEHLQEPKQFEKIAFEHLESLGFFLLTTPNDKNIIKYPLFFLKKAVARQNEQALKEHLTQGEEVFKLAEQEQHLHVFTHQELKQLLEGVGFKVVSTPRSTTVFGGASLDRRPWALGLLMFADSFLNLLPLPQLGWDLIFFCQKPE